MANDILKPLNKAVALSSEQGYITFDDIMGIALDEGLAITEVDKLSNLIVNKGIIVYDEKPEHIKVDIDIEYKDYAQTDYDKIFDDVVMLNNGLEPFIDDVKSIIPPQYRELSTLQYQVVDGNDYARTRMIEMHLRYAIKIALQRAEAFDLEIDDVIGNACIGLITAVDRYEPDVNDAFSSYMGLWCLQNISRNQETQKPLIYYPVHQKEEYFRIYPELKKRAEISGKDIEFSEENLQYIKNKLKCSDEDAYIILQSCISDISIEDGVFEEEYLQKLYSTRVHYNEVEEKVFKSSLKEEIDECLDELKPREKKVIVERFGLNGEEDKTLEEVGDLLGVTRERVRQIQKKALKKLKLGSAKKRLGVYW